MVKLFWMEDPVKRVVTVEFIAPRHINADIRPIATESGPDFSSTFAEGNGRPPIFSHQKMGPAKQTAYYPNGESSSAGR
jgi:hypothetical protein